MSFPPTRVSLNGSSTTEQPSPIAATIEGRPKKHSIQLNVDFQTLRSWTSKQVGAWVASQGPQYKDYEQLFVKHDVRGEVLEHLSDEHLKEMGITKIGHRLALEAAMDKVEVQSRNDKHSRVLWAAETYEPPYCWIFPAAWGRCFPLCCIYNACCFEPDAYRLTSTHLKIVTVQRGLNTGQKDVDTVDISQVVDMDYSTEGSCCRRTGNIDIECKTGKAGQARTRHLCVSPEELDHVEKILSGAIHTARLDTGGGRD
jgi:hypothetical protein